MKILTTISVCMLLVMSFSQAMAQETKVVLNKQDLSKPKLFKELPDRINVNIREHDDVFTYETGRAVQLKLAPNFTFSGTIVSKAVDAAANVKTVIVRSAQKEGATLSLSRYINDDNTVSYRGMIMSFKHGDAYEVAFENGSYVLIKKDAADIYEE